MSRTRTRFAIITTVLAATAGSAALTGAPATAANGPATTTGAQASVARLLIGEGDSAHACSGALVDPQWILTAAACFADNPAVSTQIPAGKPAVKTLATIGRSAPTGTTGSVSEIAELVPAPGRDLVMARLATPTTSSTPLSIAVSPAAEGDTLQAVGFGRTKTEWVPDAAHTAAMQVGTLSDTELTLAGATMDDSLCQGDTGAPLLRTTSEGTEVVGIATRSRQGNCLGVTETRTDAVATRTDDVTDWIESTSRRSWALLMSSADFNGDGKADLLAISSVDEFLYAYPGDGKGQFGKGIKVSPGKWTGMRLLATTDFTGDGKADILAVNNNGNLYLYPGNGKNGVTGTNVAGSGWTGMRVIAAADFNGDKKGDLIAAHTNGNLYFYAGKGDSFAAGAVSGGGWDGMRLLVAGDFNNDGKADTYAVHNNGSLNLYTGRGNGTFNTGLKTGAGWQSMRLVDAADFNGDGKTDLIAVHTNGSVLSYPGNGNNGFGTPIVSPPPAN